MTDDPRIRQLLRQQFRVHISEFARAREDRYWALAELCESPMEKLLLAPLMFIRPMCLHSRYEGPADLPPEARLHVQHKVGPYRLDFAYIVTPARETPIRLAIEVDGHAYHSTREQREDDNSRHRDLKEYGYELIRFTGTEINRDPERCALDVAETIDRIYAARIHDAAANHNADDEDAA